MEIKYFGQSSFFIKTKDGRLVTDPFDGEMVGFKYPKVEADIVTVSHQHKDHNQIAQIDGNPLIIELPGEYEKNGIRIFGYSSYHDKQKGAQRGLNTLFKIEAEGVSVLHCGDLGMVLDDSFIDTIGAVDILLVPVGGFYTIDQSEAVELVKKFEPSIVVPMHYRTVKHSIANFGEVAPVDDFVKKMGLSSVAPIPKLVVKSEGFEDEMKVVVLDISR